MSDRRRIQRSHIRKTRRNPEPPSKSQGPLPLWSKEDWAAAFVTGAPDADQLSADTLEDLHLVRRIQADHDPEAIKRVFDKYGWKIRISAHRYLESKLDMDDRISEVQLRLIRALRLFRWHKKGSIPALIDAIAKRHSISLHRKRRVKEVAYEDSGEVRREELVTASPKNDFAMTELFAILASTSPAAQELATFLYVQGDPGGECKIANRMDWPLRKVRSVMSELQAVFGAISDSELLALSPVRMRVLIGIEEVVNGKRSFRVTPIDEVVKGIPPIVETMLGLIVAHFDAQDPQPHDGEVDIPITPALRDALRSKVGPFASFIPEKANAFFRIAS